MQKEWIHRRLCALAAAACLLVSFCPVVSASHTVDTANGVCAVFDGANVNSQDYINARRWSQPIASYLEPLADGRWMRVQATQGDGVVVQCYDADYNVLSTRTIPEELPLFGAFYATEGAYYLLTGQRNPDRLDDVECFRLTKYDRDWNRITSVGVSDCNTTVPFDAGCARFTQLGQYLIVRTSHEMYSGHQANVTIQFDTQTMTVTDRFTGVMNVDMGYVSHSFNQFVTTENGRVVALDHGDAYPRSLVLCRYQNDASMGTFGRQCQVIDVLKIAGGVGNNDTGVSVGAFETSDTAYLVAGSTIDMQAASPDVQGERSVFVAAVDKVTGDVTMNTISTGEDAVAPHMVKLDTDSWILLWRQGEGVAYTRIDGNGRRVGEIYHADVRLSDCVPVVREGKLVWYAWRNALTEFYEISLDDWTTTRTVRVVSGHQYESTGCVDGVVTLRCTRCQETKTQTVPTEFSVWWNQNGGTGYYWSWIKESLKVGDALYYMVSLPEDAEVDSRIMELTVSDPSMIDATVWITSGELIMKKPGTVTVTIYPQYNPAAGKSFTLTIEHAGDTHDFSDEWKSNGASHWHECLCGERADTAAHEFVWMIDREPTENESGVKHEECTVCGFVRSPNTVIPPLNHVHELRYIPAKEATRDEAGHIAYWYCDGCEKYFADENAENEIMQDATIILPLSVPGDVNRDGSVDTADAVLVLQKAAGLIDETGLDVSAADVNADGAIDTADAVLILQKAAGLIERFPAEND